MTPDEAIELVATSFIESCLDADFRAIGWEDYPEIGEHDWDRVIDRVAALTPEVDLEELSEALRFLAERAGYRRHLRNHDTPCSSCRGAHADANAKARKNSSK